MQHASAASTTRAARRRPATSAASAAPPNSAASTPKSAIPAAISVAVFEVVSSAARRLGAVSLASTKARSGMTSNSTHGWVRCRPPAGSSGAFAVIVATAPSASSTSLTAVLTSSPARCRSATACARAPTSGPACSAMFVSRMCRSTSASGTRIGPGPSLAIGGRARQLTRVAVGQRPPLLLGMRDPAPRRVRRGAGLIGPVAPDRVEGPGVGQHRIRRRIRTEVNDAHGLRTPGTSPRQVPSRSAAARRRDRSGRARGCHAGPSRAGRPAGR